MEPQTDSESIQDEYNTEDLPEAVDAESRSTPKDQSSVIRCKSRERQMTPNDSCCRICYQKNLPEPNLSLCACKGTLELVHKSCLELWLASSRATNCELCGYRFNLKKKLKYGVFRAIVIWLTLRRSREDRIEMALDILKLSAALAVLFIINYQTLNLLGTVQRVDMSLQDFVDPFLEQELNWNDFADVGNKIFNIFSLAVATPLTLDYIATKMHNLDMYISHWYRWYEAQVDVELVSS